MKTHSDVMGSMPEPVRSAFEKWWREHETFNIEFDAQALIAEAWLEASERLPSPNRQSMGAEDYDGMRRQIVGPGNFWYPPLAVLPVEAATKQLNSGTCWIRSVHYEYYYSYAVIENCDSAERFVVQHIIGAEGWGDLNALLDEWS